jgi:hypothetical protein
MTDTQLTQNEVSERMTTGMGLVYDLFNEVNSFMRILVDSIDGSEIDAKMQAGRATKFRFPQPKRGSSPAEYAMHCNMGLYYELSPPGSNEEEDEFESDIEEEDEDDDSQPGKKGKKASVQIAITPDTTLLGIRLCLYDPKLVKAGGFEPFIVAAMLTDITHIPSRGQAKKLGSSEPIQNFKVKRGRMYRAIRLLGPDLQVGKSTKLNIPGFSLGTKVVGVESRSLASFDTEEAVGTFTDAIVAMTNNS